MDCPICGEWMRQFGYNRNGSHRFRCDTCRRCFTDPNSQPADRRRLPRAQAVNCLRMLLEGNSLRSTHRLAGTARNTILATMVEAGQRSQVYLDGLRNLPAADVQIDELWAFVAMKERTRERLNRGPEVGDIWTFLAIERDTKLILTSHVGKRTPDDTLLFVEKLRRATRPSRIQLSSDRFTPYPGIIGDVFGVNVDYGQIVKVFGPTAEQGTASRYSPGQVTSVDRWQCLGNPDEDQICTSHVERANKTLRMQIRRFTRLTDGHSKKWENHEAAVALFVAYYNYCRVHMTLMQATRHEGQPMRKVTPAMAAGLTDHVWSVAELLEAVGVPE